MGNVTTVHQTSYGIDVLSRFGNYNQEAVPQATLTLLWSSPNSPVHPQHDGLLASTFKASLLDRLTGCEHY